MARPHHLSLAETAAPAIHSTIVDRIRHGDARAFQSVFAEYYEKLCRFAERYVESPAGAEELVAEVFCNLWIQRETLDVRTALDRYLYGAVRNRALNMQRNARVAQRWADRQGTDPSAWMGQPPMDTERAMERQETAQRVLQAVSVMPPRRQEVARLHWLDQLTAPEVAARSGLSLAAVKKHIERAFAELKKSLGPSPR